MENKILDTYLKPKKNKVSIFLTKILLSIILFFLVLIVINFNDSYKTTFKKYVFDNSLNFYDFKNLYNKFSLGNDAKQVMSLANGIEYNGIEKYEDGEKLLVNAGTIIKPLQVGVVVFKGEKDKYKNTVIIQGADGFDIWYGNLEDISVDIYEYIDTSTILGTTDEMYLKIAKDGKVYTYEEYQNQN